VEAVLAKTGRSIWNVSSGEAFVVAQVNLRWNVSLVRRPFHGNTELARFLCLIGDIQQSAERMQKTVHWRQPREVGAFVVF
jgi:hypothetical protein